MATRIGTEDRTGHFDGRRESDVFRRFYAGLGVTCHVGCGGRAEVVRVGTAADGRGELWFECLSCAQRMRCDVPGPSESERLTVGRALDGGGEAVCPRHARPTPLQRRGRQWVCPECGVRYRE